MAKTKFYSIMDGEHPLSRKQKALYDYLFPIINKEVILLVSKDDDRDDNILDVVNGDSFLELNQNGLAVCDTFVNENGLIEYYVICFYDTSDVKEYEKTTWDISRHPEKGENFDGLGYSDLIIIDDKGNLLKCSQKTSLFESKKSARKSIKENKMILSFEAFKDICVEEIGYSYIGSFNEHKGTYFVSVIDDKRADKFCKYLRDNYDCECTFWKITDPYDDDYGLYRVEVI